MKRFIAGIGIAFQIIQVAFLIILGINLINWNFIKVESVLILAWILGNAFSILGIYYGFKEPQLRR